MVEKRRPIELLPAVQQTETLTKFFAATVDHLFQPESVEFINGYIGKRPTYWNPAKDFYIGESNKSREDYQFGPIAVSYDQPSNSTDHLMFYDDLLGQLSFHGANITNHSRLFESEYYSWCPPIDPDKILNYGRYLWLVNGPNTIILDDQTDALGTIVGQSTYTYTGSWQRTNNDGSTTNQVAIQGITTPLVFTSGLKVRFTNDANPAYTGKDFIVEAVGQQIILVPEISIVNYPWDTTGWDMKPWSYNNIPSGIDYITMPRGCQDGNTWSYLNRWFHQSVVELSQTSIADPNIVAAKRPIIEFQRDLELFNYGTKLRTNVDLVSWQETNIFAAIVGKTNVYIDGIILQNGFRILATSDSNIGRNNRIYRVLIDEQTSQCQLVLETDGVSKDGTPTLGERVFVTYGNINQDSNWWYNGSRWISGQTRIGTALPLFALYDSDGNSLNDPAIYPNSTFSGNTIWSYLSTDGTAIYDPAAQTNLSYDQFGQIQFANNILQGSWTYLSDLTIMSYTGYRWFHITSNDFYGNTWYRADNLSRQYIVDEFDIYTGTINTAISGNTVSVVNNSIGSYGNTLAGTVLPTNTFEIDQIPAIDPISSIAAITVDIIRNQKKISLAQGSDFSCVGANVILATIAQAGDRVIIRSWSPTSPGDTIKGYYELPTNLTTNPNNSDPIILSRGDFGEQFASIITNQLGITGLALSTNNWRDTMQARNAGTVMTESRAPLLKLMVLNGSNVSTITDSVQTLTDPVQAINYAHREYTRFYGKFIRSLFNLYNGLNFNTSNPTSAWVSTAIKQINLGKTSSSPWANSGYDLTQPPGSYASIPSNEPTYVPPTAVRLGIAPAYQPIVYFDTSYTTPKLTIETHTGARLILQDLTGQQLGTIAFGLQHTHRPENLTHPVAQAWLQFELNQYNCLPNVWKNPDAVLPFDIRSVTPGKWRNQSGYSRSEYLSILLPQFSRWVATNQVDPYTNSIDVNNDIQINNPFLLNYRTVTDQQGQPIPGYWRGIYRWFYDTDRPHISPWEMLGFAQKPNWWDAEYGVAPYTSGNTVMWNDLTNGVIRRGPRVGTYAIWARPGLSSCIPVDENGNLLPPMQAGCIRSMPSNVDAAAPWQFGDGAPIESVWLYSLDWSFTEANAAYLMKPAQFIEYAWDTLRTVKVYPNTVSSQWLYVDTNSRRPNSQFYIHRENPLQVGSIVDIPNESTLSYYGSAGIQHWFSEYLIGQNYAVTSYLGKVIRGADVRLAHRFGGFVTNDSLRVLVDSFGQLGYSSQLVPAENTHIELYRSTSIGEKFYTGVQITQAANG